MKQQLQRITTTLEKIDRKSHHQQIQPSFAINAESFYKQKNQQKTPSLPKVKPIPFSNHRHAANPSLARNILQEIDTMIYDWQKKLNKLQREIQDIYLEGPIVDGWLESHSRNLETEEGKTVSQPRKGTEDKLMDYIEEITTDEFSCQLPRAGYRLCGLDENGQPWSKDCPLNQVGELSVAIARYQKLKQLLYQKKQLETNLSNLAETLVILHSNLTGKTNTLNL